MMPGAETPPVCPRRPVPNEPTSYDNNSNKMMERVETILGAIESNYCTWRALTDKRALRA